MEYGSHIVDISVSVILGIKLKRGKSSFLVRHGKPVLSSAVRGHAIHVSLGDFIVNPSFGEWKYWQ